MRLFKLTIKGEEFKVAVADNNELRAKGLSGLPKLGKRKGMLFAWPEPTIPTMIMVNMNFDLDFLFLDKNFTVVDMGSLEKDSKENIASSVPVNYVLEIPKNTIKNLNISVNTPLLPSEELISSISQGVKKFKAGGSFELVGEKKYNVKETDIKADPNMLQILDNDGIVVSNIEPGARIFSRKHTKEMIDAYKKGDKLALAKLMIKVLDIQDNQDPDYVKK